MIAVASRPRPLQEASRCPRELQSASGEHKAGLSDADPLFPQYARPRGSDAASAMLMKRLRTQISDKKITMHSLRHRMKDKLRNTGCPEAISLAILGHSTNTVLPKSGRLFPQLSVDRVIKRYAYLRRRHPELAGTIFHSTRKWFITQCERTGVPEHYTATLVGSLCEVR